MTAVLATRRYMDACDRVRHGSGTLADKETIIAYWMVGKIQGRVDVNIKEWVDWCDRKLASRVD